MVDTSAVPRFAAPLSPLPGITSRLLTIADAALLQRFLDDNPAYFIAVHGAAPKPGEALNELTSAPPVSYRYSDINLIGFLNRAGALVAYANLVTDLFATGVWLIGTFYVATEHHGRGVAPALFNAIENWAAQNGADWLRLGVVIGNTRAQRFWTRVGFTIVGVRAGVVMGARTNALQVIVKALRGGTLDDYRALVAHD